MSAHGVPPSATVTIRPATEADLEAITRIYNDAGVGTTASYDLEPVSVDERREWLERHTSSNHPVLVAVADGEVLGFAGYGSFRDKAGYGQTVEHSVYVADGARALGVGRMLMLALIDRARGDGIHVMVGSWMPTTTPPSPSTASSDSSRWGGCRRWGASSTAGWMPC